MAITIVYQLLSISFDNYLVFYVISGVIETKKKKKKEHEKLFRRSLLLRDYKNVMFYSSHRWKRHFQASQIDDQARNGINHEIKSLLKDYGLFHFVSSSYRRRLNIGKLLTTTVITRHVKYSRLITENFSLSNWSTENTKNEKKTITVFNNLYRVKRFEI